jgi:hypothetical protein
MSNEKRYLEKCRLLVEEKVGWGDSTQWQNQDFEALSERIYNETKVTLSVSTLKRIWGKVKYEGSPNLATLNALAQFVGYENWRAFTSLKQEVTQKASRKSSFINTHASKGVIMLVAIGAITILLWALQQKPKKLNYKDISFGSKPVTSGVPNTVIFHYNAKDSNADSVFIQQSWDPTRRFKVEKELTEFTSTYYTPGYFRAKLILDTTIVKEHDIFIESDGWLATVHREPIPVYARHNQIYDNDTVRMEGSFFEEQQIDLEKEKLWTSFYRVVKEEAVPATDFSMEVTVRNTFGKGWGVCSQTKIVLLATDGVIVIPLSIAGCVGELDLRVGEKIIRGKTNDLSAFGVDFTEWVNVRCNVKDNQVIILVNNTVAFQESFHQNIGKIIGTRILFMGTGEVAGYSIKPSEN